MKKILLLSVISVLQFISVNAQLSESFDAVGFPPAGWLNLTNPASADPAAVWARAVAGSFGGDLVANTNSPYNVDPHSGAGMATFNSYVYGPGAEADLITSAVNLTTGGPHIISFWLYRDNTYTAYDSVKVYINTSQSVTGATYLGGVPRKRSFAPVETGPNGWYKYTFDIPASFNSASNYFVLKAVGDYGNNIFIDDVVVASQPTCGTPTGILLTNYNFAAGTLTANWSAPAVGSPTGYEWVINTTGIAPASGTAVGTNTASVSGITANVVNYLLVRTDCGAGNFSSWASYAFSALPCATLTTPASGTVDAPQSITFTWQPVSGAASYNFYLGTTPANPVNIGNTSATTATISNLIPLETYYWYTVPVLSGVAAPNAGCPANSLTIGVESNTPVNNPCSGAITITPANIAGNGIVSTTVGSTISLAASTCAGSVGIPDDDVWFQFTTTSIAPTGILTITPSGAVGLFDIVAQVYAANSCTSLGVAVACADGTVDTDPEVLNLSSLAPNTHYYMRVFSYSGDPADRGEFTITVSAGITLPIRLAIFTARRSNGVNVLNWTTEQELNTSHFMIERSSDGRNFAAIGQVAAAGNSNSTRNYTFTDSRPSRGNNYYRLRTIDKDNSSKLSDTRRIRNDGIADVSVYPNPVKDKLTISINADKASDGQLMILDLSGKIVYSRSVKLPQGNTILPVTVNGIAAGSYIMKIQLNDDVIVRKFNKE